MSARLIVYECYHACISAINRNLEVVDDQRVSLSMQDIEQRLHEHIKWLDGFDRISQGSPFLHWAGTPLLQHDNEALPSQVFDEKLNYLNDRHTVRDHVNIDENSLRDTMDHKQERVNSTFYSYEIAEQAIAAVLAFYWDDVTTWLRLTAESEPDFWKRSCLVLTKQGFDVKKQFGYVVKYRKPTLHITTKLRAVLVRDQDAPKGFWIKDAYPIL